MPQDQDRLLHAPRRRALSPVGRAWWNGLYRTECRVPEPTISALTFFDEPPKLEDLASEMEKTIWPLDRFHSIVVDNKFEALDGPMDKAYHFSELQFANEKAIDDYVQSLMAKPLDHSRPLWLVQKLNARTGRSAILIRIHHVISDGLGLLFAFLPMVKCEEGDVLSKIPLPAILLGSHAAQRPVRRAAAAPPTSLWKKLCCPALAVCNCLRGVLLFFQGILSILALKHDSTLDCNLPLADRKPYMVFNDQQRYVRMPSIPAAAIKQVRQQQSCSFNDVLLAAFTGGLRRYLMAKREQGQLTSRTVCKTFMLIGLPRPVDPANPSVSLANNILTPAVKLPIEVPEPRTRLQQTVAACNDLKSASFLMGIKLTSKLLTAVLPTGIMKSLASEAVTKCTANFTNLPFPDVPCTLCGQEIKEVQCVFPNILPQISLISYNSNVHWNLVANPALFPEPEALGKFVLEELSVLASS
mmetsp:Transcript_34159/g.72672  ORF Transcript_34159/g.72672 Transcript_34159/m.72672 type:complete len:471 (-) Transcript_34159:35-1447(-)